MTGSPQPPTTSSGSTGNVGRYPLATPPPGGHVSHVPDQVGLRYGWVEIIGPERRYVSGWSSPMVPTRCTGCGRERWTDLSNLSRGKSKGCQRCSQPRQVPKKLERVLTAAKQRCTNPHDRAWSNYGGRGITFGFPSVLEAGRYVQSELGWPPPPGRSELDRIDNSRGYEPGNLRWASRAEQVANRRNTRLDEYRSEDWPYAENTVRRLLGEGLTRSEILERAEQAVFDRRKNWRGIAARLASMTS